MNNKNIEKDQEIKKENIDDDEEIKEMQEKEEQIKELEKEEDNKENNNNFLFINLSIIGIIVFGAFQFLRN